MNLPVGKLKHGFLKELLPTQNKNVDLVVGPQLGEDAAVIKLGNNYLVATSDPITFATEDIGWYVVCVNSNDIAAMGAVPKWLLVTLLLPEDATTPAMVRDIMAQLTQACAEFDIALCGGHTEVTPAVTQPVVIGQMMGVTDKNALFTSADARIGDTLILTKGLGIEATAIIAREREAQLREKCDAQFLERAKNYLMHPGISVLRDSQIAIATGGVHAMHDVTEGGVSTATYELATAAGLGVVLYSDKLLGSPILYGDITRTMCDMFELNPLGVISSGAMLIASEPEKGETICQALDTAGINADIIGKFLPSEDGFWLEDTAGTQQPLPIFETDEIAKLFSSSNH
ncbi:MAG: AIR synthase family protein [Candidatus Poribacteria bacterium]|nr:AIR synthase family protein [Candidatus Poribacteria bacterium]